MPILFSVILLSESKMILVTRPSARLCCAFRTQLPKTRHCVSRCCQTTTKLTSRINSALVRTHSAPLIDHGHQDLLCYRQTRHYSSGHSLLCCPLSNRTLVKIKGRDSSNFLQGLITNDMRLLTTQQPAMYTMMLNVQVLLLILIISMCYCTSMW